ncbi:protein sneaky-like [Achroia grisella]|uniref:protein sneaky-like n=1 Tax=Achroia grisella TaxID=688607 RepID=UPI0027D22C53|nr:protein sneaky-like [Achroia grisella]
MSIFALLYINLKGCLHIFCRPIHKIISEIRDKQCIRHTLSFIGGFMLAQFYYLYMLKRIPLPYYFEICLSLLISVLLGIGNTISTQLRCISLLTFPMYCGKPGRGVLKAIVLTYVVAGPITNMGLNAKEVVRVFACSTQLSYNLSRTKHALISKPLRNAMIDLQSDINQMKDAIRSVKNVIDPIETEIEGTNELSKSREQNDMVDDFFRYKRRSEHIDNKYLYMKNEQDSEIYLKDYLKKLEYRCENQISRAAAVCSNAFVTVHNMCYESAPPYAAWSLCWPMKLQYICNIKSILQEFDICNSRKQIDPGLGEGYVYLKKSKKVLTDLKEINLQYKMPNFQELFDIQDAAETGEQVMHAFEEKNIVMRTAIVIVNICMALLFLRIYMAAVTYHDMYLTEVEYDNIYITSYFKTIDARRRKKKQCTLLPLKKMERYKYVDVHSFSYVPTERHILITHILKVMLEVITATTFVMLDRLFYEALDVVRQHAEIETNLQGTRDLEIKVEGTGTLASMVQKILDNLNERSPTQYSINTSQCLPRPRLMPASYFIKIYGGYLWIIILLYLNPYTVRLRRLICSYFYPRREKQRILHLYNDILKNRLKMQKTLRRKAVQAVRAHYLSGENLLSMRMKFPRLLGWLSVLPAARMTCLICGETEPRNNTGNHQGELWHSCIVPKCPFVYCVECWREVGARCLACDPSLAELSDIDSLSEEEMPRF